MKGVETGVCQNNDDGTRTLVDSVILNKKRCSLTSQKVCFDLKRESLFNMIFFLVVGEIRGAEMPVDYLRCRNW